MDKTTATPSARTLEPHTFEQVGTSSWCAREDCGWAADAYVHASEAERRAFDEQQSPGHKDEAGRDARQLGLDRDWFGYLTTANYQAVTDGIRRLIAGKRYTWVASLSPALAGERAYHHRPEVRTGMEADSIKGELRSAEGVTRPWAHIWIHDSYGVWGISSTHASQAEARAASPESRTYLHFKRDRYGAVLEIEHYAASGNHLWWVIAVEGSGW